MTDPDGSQEGEAHDATPHAPDVEAIFQRLMSEAARVRRMELARQSAERAGEGAAEADLSKRSHAAPPGAPPRTAAHHPERDLEREPDPAAREGAPGGAAVRPGARWPGLRRSLSPGGRAAPALEPRQLMAARMLLSGRRVTDVAAALGIDRHTLLRWRRDPAFDGEVRRMAMEMSMPGVEGAVPEVSPPEGGRSA